MLIYFTLSLVLLDEDVLVEVVLEAKLLVTLLLKWRENEGKGGAFQCSFAFWSIKYYVS